MLKHRMCSGLALLACGVAGVPVGWASATHAAAETGSGQLAATVAAARTDARQERIILGESASSRPGPRVFTARHLRPSSSALELRTVLRRRSATSDRSDPLTVSDWRTGCTETVLHAFEGSPSDGDWPAGRLVADRSGLFYGVTVVGGAHDNGTVFTLSPSGSLTTIYAFERRGAAGWGRKSGLIINKAGDFYVTTETGGTHDEGTVFEVTPGGTGTVLYSFRGPPDGAAPATALTLGRDGTVYGTTFSGGAHGQGTVFTLDPAGTETVLHSFKGGSSDGSGPRSSLTMDGAGNLYGTTESGGADGDGVVFKITPAGQETILYSFKAGVNDGINPLGKLIFDDEGNLYGVTRAGGTDGLGTVFRLDPAGTETVLYSFKGGSRDGSAPHAGLLRDRAGNLYGTTEFGGPRNDGTVFKLSPRGVETILHAFKGGRRDGQAPAAGLLAGAAGLYGTTPAGGAHNDGIAFKIACGVPSDDRMASVRVEPAVTRPAPARGA